MSGVGGMATVTALPAPRPVPSAGRAPAPPDWLSAPAKSIWRRLVPRLAEAYPDTLSTIDVPALALMVEHYAIASYAARAMRAKGNVPMATDVDEAHRDRLRKAPASQVMRDHGRAFLELAREFGLTPRARAKLGDVTPPVVPDDGDDDDLFDV